MKQTTIFNFVLTIATMLTLNSCEQRTEHTEAAATVIEDHSQLVKNFLVAMDANDSAKLATLTTSDFKAYHPMEPEPIDIGEFYAHANRINSMLSNAKHTVAESISSTDAVASRGVFEGKHTGQAPGMPAPTGNDVNVEWLTMAHVKNGKISDLHVQFNQTKFMSQLGVKMGGN